MSKSITIALLLKSEVGTVDKINTAGTERIFLQDISLLRQQGFNVMGFARFEKHFLVRKIPFIYQFLVLKIFLQKYPLLQRFNLKKLSELLKFFADFLYCLHFYLRNHQADIFIGYSIPLLSIFRPEKTIIIMQNVTSLPGLLIFESRYKRTHFLACSHDLVHQLKKESSVFTKKNIVVLYNAVDQTIFKPLKKHTKSLKSSQGLSLLYASAWAPEKGLHLLLSALELLPTTIKESVKLTIASSKKLWYLDFPEEYAAYFSLVDNKIKANKNITLLNGVSHQNLPKVYSSHDFLVFPSIWHEPFGLVVLESIACGLPVIGFNHGALPEILSPTNSILVKKKNASTLATAIALAFRQKKNHKSRQTLLDLQLKNKDMIKDVRAELLSKYIKSILRNITR